jgi:hypothetical protein
VSSTSVDPILGFATDRADQSDDAGAAADLSGEFGRWVAYVIWAWLGVALVATIGVPSLGSR